MGGLQTKNPLKGLKLTFRIDKIIFHPSADQESLKGIETKDKVYTDLQRIRLQTKNPLKGLKFKAVGPDGNGIESADQESLKGIETEHCYWCFFPV